MNYHETIIGWIPFCVLRFLKPNVEVSFFIVIVGH